MNDQNGTGPVPEQHLFRWKFAGAEFDEARWELRLGNQVQELERKPLEMLALLLRHAGEVVTKDELLEAVWPGVIVVEGALTSAMSKLRKALGDETQTLIATVPRAGYRLLGKVERKSVAEAHPSMLALKAGEPVPRREHWLLRESLDVSESGEVWLAAHAKTHERRVFKFSADGSRLASLKREATISRLLHDALGERADFVRVLEWNFEEPPYFLECEYGGLDMNRWAESIGGLATVPMQQRLDLLVRIAESVAAAHAVGVLHKDLKPGNILIETSAGGALQARLTDFGSGRLLDPAQLARFGITRMGFTQTQSIDSGSDTGTPLYLAPEILSGHTPTVQSDIYALGVILYQLIVGDFRKPMAPGWEQEIGDELLREDITAVANGNPALRLASAQQLAERLRTLDARRSVRDTEKTAQARAQVAEEALKRVRARRPWLIATGTALVAGLLVSTLFYAKANSARRVADEQRLQAQAINRFLNQDVIAQANPDIGGRKDVTVLEAIQKASSQIDDRFSSEPSIAASLHQTVGSAYQTMNEWLPAESEFRRAVAEDKKAFGEDTSQEIIARLKLAEVLAGGGKPEEANRIYLDAQRRIARLSPAQPHLEMLAMVTQMTLETKQVDYQLAKKKSAAILALADRIQTTDPKALADDQELILQTRIMHAFYMAQTGEREAAEKQLRLLLISATKALGAHHPLTLKVKYYLAQTLLMEKPWEDDPTRKAQLLQEAENILTALKPEVDSLLGPKSPLAAGVLEELGSVYEAKNDWPHAIQYYEQVYRLDRDKYGDANNETVILMDTVGGSYERYGDVDSAIKWFGMARQYGAPLLNANNKQLIDYQFARSLFEGGRCSEAEPLVAGLHPGAAALADPRKDWAGKMQVLQGQLLVCEGKFDAAEKTLEKALKQLAVVYPSGGWTVDQAQLWLGSAKDHRKIEPGQKNIKTSGT